MTQSTILKKIVFGALTKYPRCNGWQTKTVSDSGKIDGIVTNGGAHCGPNGDMFVVDIDQVANTLEIWHSLVKKYGLHKDVPHQLTTTGGHHYLFNYKPELLQKSISGVLVDRSIVTGITERDGKFYDSKGKQLLHKVEGNRTLVAIGIDFLSSGCQIVISPSTHVCNKKKCNSPCAYIGKRYTWITKPPAGKTRSEAVEAFQAAKYDLPDWLMRLYKKTAFVGPNYELLPLSSPKLSLGAKPTIAARPRQAPQAQLLVEQKSTRSAFSKSDFVWSVCECLAPERLVERESWIKVGFALKNELGEDGLELWYELSTLHYEDADEAEHERIWAGMNRGNSADCIGLGTLITWAREDCKAEFNKCEIRKAQYGTFTKYMRYLLGGDERRYYNSMFEDANNGFSFEQIRDFYECPAENDAITVSHWAKCCIREIIDHGKTRYVIKTARDGYKIIDQFSRTQLNKVLYIVKMDGKKKNRVITFAKVLEGLSKYVYDSVEFISDHPRVFSTFRGFAAADLPAPRNSVDIRPLKEHIFRVLCAENKEVYEYVMSWFANIVQHPERKNGVAINIVGKQGCGKTCILNFICEKIVGNKYSLQNATVDAVLGTFNGILEDKLLVVLNELKNHSVSGSADKFKALITDDKLIINKKNARLREMRNYANFICVSNNRSVMRLSGDDRRFLCLEASDKYVGDTEYFDRLYSALDNPEMPRAFYDYLMTRTNLVDLRKIPVTSFKEEIIEASKPVTQVWFEDIATGELEFPEEIIRPNRNGGVKVFLKDMYDTFLEWKAKYKPQVKINRSTFKNELARLITVKPCRIKSGVRNALGWNNVEQWKEAMQRKKSYNADSNDE